MSLDQDPVKMMAWYDFTSDTIKLAAKTENQTLGKVNLATDIVFKECKEGTEAPSFVTLDMESAQKLFDSLYDAGLRLTKPRNDDAKDLHLQDMRKIVAHQLGVEF